jgi:hypothetical protein
MKIQDFKDLLTKAKQASTDSLEGNPAYSQALDERMTQSIDSIESMYGKPLSAIEPGTDLTIEAERVYDDIQSCL